MSEIDDLIAAGEQLQKQRAEALLAHGSHDQETHGNWADGISDLEAKASINVGDVIRFIPEGGTRQVTVKVTGKDRGRGGGISGVRVVGGEAKTGVNHYQTPGVDKIEKVTAVRETTKGAPVEKPAVEPVKEKLAGMKERIAAKTAAEVERLKKKNEAVIGELEKAAAEKKAATAAPPKYGEPGFAEYMRAETQKEVDRRAEEIKNAYYEPSSVKINETGMALPHDVRNGIQQGREAMKAAGLKGDYGTVEVKEDDPKSSRYGGYIPGLNRIVMNARTLPDKEGDGAFTFTHEYGHHVDHFEARRTGGQDHSRSAAFKAALKKTQAYQDLVSDKARLRGMGRYAMANGRPSGRISYLLKPTELFARAFAQWTALKSGNPAMGRVLNRRRVDHWEDADFAPLMEYFDKNFGERRVRTAAGAKRYGQSIGQVIAADEESEG